MSKQQGFSKIVLIIIFFIILGGGYYLWQNQLGSSTPKSAIDTTNWQTYRSDEYGFELKYPVTYKLYKSSTVLDNNQIVWFPKDYVPLPGTKAHYPITLNFGSSSITLMPWLRTIFGPEVDNWDTYPNFTRSPQELARFSSSISFALPNAPLPNTQLIQADLNILGFRVGAKNIVISSQNFPTVNPDNKVMHQILSTFKFTR